MPRFTIKTASFQDLDTITDFNLRLAHETENLALNEDLLRKSMQAILSDERKGVYLLAYDGETVIGQLMYVFEWSTWRNANFMWLTDLYVLPQYRRQGAFKAFFNYVMDFYHKREDIIGLRFYVDKTNTAAVPVYKSVGWKESNYNLWEMKKHEE